MFRHYARAAALLACLFHLSTARGPAQSAGPSGSARQSARLIARVPFVLNGNIIYLPVRVNDSHRLV